MEVTGVIKSIDETKTYGTSGFRKREMIITTNEQYPQMLLIEFVQDKCDLLDNYQIAQSVKIHINLRGREWINPEGKEVYFNSIQGWRIEEEQTTEEIAENVPSVEQPTDDNEPDNLPF